MLLVKPAPNLASALIYHQNVNNQGFVVCDTFHQKMRDGVIVWRPGEKCERSSMSTRSVSVHPRWASGAIRSLLTAYET